MEFLTDPVLLARIQFALTAMYHYVFVPLSIGLGLIVAIFETKYYRSQSVEDAAASRFWIKVFTATFALGVATGITMEFSFGTNWADYARFVGDIFGAPLAAEALLAFFLESVFLGVLLQPCGHVAFKFQIKIDAAHPCLTPYSSVAENARAFASCGACRARAPKAPAPPARGQRA